MGNAEVNGRENIAVEREWNGTEHVDHRHLTSGCDRQGNGRHRTAVAKTI